MGLRVGAWNIQKQNSGDNNADFVALRMSQIFVTHRIDVFFFEEVAHREGEGRRLLEIIAQNLNNFPTRFPRRRSNFQVSYRAGIDHRGRTTSCNIGLIYDRNAFAGPVSVVYEMPPDYTRPFPVISSAGIGIGGIHAKSGIPRVAAEEIFTACTTIASNHDRRILIGDMNIDYDDNSIDLNGPSMIGFEKTKAAIPETYHGNGAYPPASLDYCWSTRRMGPVALQLPTYTLSNFRRVDHAPILYHFRGLAYPV